MLQPPPSLGLAVYFFIPFTANMPHLFLIHTQLRFGSDGARRRRGSCLRAHSAMNTAIVFPSLTLYLKNTIFHLVCEDVGHVG